MKHIALLLLVIFVSTIVIAASPYTTPPGGSATGVPSSTQNGLVPNTPSTARGDTVFLRNSSGQSFRGVVPYGSSFYYDRSSGGTLQRFSSPPSTSTVAGSSSYFDPRSGVRLDVSKPSTGGSNPMVNPYAPANLPQISNTQFGPLPRPISSRPGDLTRELNRRINPNWTKDVSDTKTDINALAKESRRKNDQQVDPALLLPKTPDSELNSNLLQDVTEPQPTSNPYEQIKNKTMDEIQQQQADAAKKKAEAAVANPKNEEKVEYKSIFDIDSESEGGAPTEPAPTRVSSPVEAKVTDYFAAAEQYLNEGRFYKAADAYALAAIWQPENGLAYAGQSWALFAAGEYMSSAYYLGRAISINPKFAEKKVNVAAFLRDRDIFDNRLVEMTRWQQQSKSGEMAFLMSYILWQDGKTQQAKNAIKLATDLMPDDAAVQLLAKVISAPASLKTLSPETAIADPNQMDKK